MCAAEEKGGEEKGGEDLKGLGSKGDDDRIGSPHPWLPGTLVQRDLDGFWFPARVVRVDSSDPGNVTYDIEYLDDGKNESMVEQDELRLGGPLDATAPVPAQPLPLPLENLLVHIGKGDEDEYGAQAKTPRAIVHSNGSMSKNAAGDEQDEEDSMAIVVNGSESRLAVGGGIRGIRSLRQTSRA